MRRLELKTPMEVLLVCSNPVRAYKPSDNLRCVVNAWAAVKHPMQIAAQRTTADSTCVTYTYTAAMKPKAVRFVSPGAVGCVGV